MVLCGRNVTRRAYLDTATTTLGSQYRAVVPIPSELRERNPELGRRSNSKRRPARSIGSVTQQNHPLVDLRQVAQELFGQVQRAYQIRCSVRLRASC